MRSEFSPIAVSLASPVFDLIADRLLAGTNPSLTPQYLLGLEIMGNSKDNRIMTVIADDRKRIVLPDAKPGDRFDIESSNNGFILRRLQSVESKPANVTVQKREGFSIWETDQPINEQAIREALAEFPP